ncbi:unnamed protein product, partial [Phaeothamnion confervicola]
LPSPFNHERGVGAAVLSSAGRCSSWGRACSYDAFLSWVDASEEQGRGVVGGGVVLRHAGVRQAVGSQLPAAAVCFGHGRLVNLFISSPAPTMNQAGVGSRRLMTISLRRKRERRFTGWYLRNFVNNDYTKGQCSV